jgi:hypothetical protein
MGALRRWAAGTSRGWDFHLLGSPAPVPGRPRGRQQFSPDQIAKVRDDNADKIDHTMLTCVGTAASHALSLLNPDSALLGGSVRFSCSAVTRSNPNSLKINNIQRKRSMRTSLLIALSLATSMVSANAASNDPSKLSGPPSEGTDSAINTFIVTGLNTIKMGEHAVVTYESKGIHHSIGTDGGPMNADMGVSCTGIYENDGETILDHGACIAQDKDGDKILVKYHSSNGVTGEITLISGTGKFEGITGSGTYKSVQHGLHADDTVNRSVSTETFHWKLP